ncbi:hypothetical protein GCM10011445_27340 [Pseudocitrobacter faecalis]|nr:hypothetical protein GCM10011445_27340 [Pseudocitrobacter faecalis]
MAAHIGYVMDITILKLKNISSIIFNCLFLNGFIFNDFTREIITWINQFTRYGLM